MSKAMSSERGVQSLPPHLYGFALMHVAMRRDAQRLVDAAPRVTPSTTGPVAVWWKQLHDIIEWHHRSEDDLLWPALRALVAGFGTIEREMHHDHSALDEAMAQVSAALRRRSSLSVLTPAAHRLRQVLLDHLRHEEAAIFPVLGNEMSLRAYLAVEQRIIGSAPARVRSCLQPWMFDGADPAVTAQVAAGIPLPARVLGNSLLRRRYQRVVAPVLALG